ncbi:MAG TPA: hypothetical protein VKW78_04535 [Terriglobales bacterium]|nr:hypothetical protein [Terriglobales bacterium]
MRHLIFIFALVVCATLAFAQTRKSQASSQQPQVDKGTTGTIPAIGSPSTFSEESNLSGCVVDGQGRFWLSGSGNGSMYSLQAGDMSQYVNHVVRLSGHPLARPDQSGYPGFHVDNIVQTGELCNPEVVEQLPAIAITGKAGNEGDVITETTTHVTQNTAGPDTQAGVMQKRGKNGATNHNPTVYDLPGHPPNWEQVGESRGAATDLAASAEQTEVGAPEGTFGVGSTRPNYQNPNSSQEIGGAQAPIQHSADTNGSTPVKPKNH